MLTIDHEDGTARTDLQQQWDDPAPPHPQLQEDELICSTESVPPPPPSLPARSPSPGALPLDPTPPANGRGSGLTHRCASKGCQPTYGCFSTRRCSATAMDRDSGGARLTGAQVLRYPAAPRSMPRDPLPPQ